MLTHVDAYFASSEAKAVTLHVTGSGAGTVTGDEGSAGPGVTCAHDCTIWLEPGAPLALHAQTPSTFGGWGGACTGADKPCDQGAITQDRDVTAMFSADDREVKTLIDPASVEFAAAAYASDGDLIVAGSPGFTPKGFVRRQAADGTVRWSTEFQTYGSPSAVALDTTGAIYAITQSDGVVKLSATGEILWKSGFAPPYGSDPAVLSVMPDGRVAVLAGSQSVVTLAANGSLSWFANLGTCVASAVAASPANIVAVACTDGVIERFDPTGAALPAWTIPDSAGQTHTVSMAFDATGTRPVIANTRRTPRAVSLAALVAAC